MAAPDIERIESCGSGPELWSYRAWVREGVDVEPFTVEVSGTQATVAGFGDEGPSDEWLRDRLRYLASGRLSNYGPILPQMRSWPSPIVLLADPS
jgi:hypothetical protein